MLKIAAVFAFSVAHITLTAAACNGNTDQNAVPCTGIVKLHAKADGSHLALNENSTDACCACNDSSLRIDPNDLTSCIATLAPTTYQQAVDLVLNGLTLAEFEAKAVAPKTKEQLAHEVLTGLFSPHDDDLRITVLDVISAPDDDGVMIKFEVGTTGTDQSIISAAIVAARTKGANGVGVNVGGVLYSFSRLSDQTNPPSSDVDCYHTKDDCFAKIANALVSCDGNINCIAYMNHVRGEEMSFTLCVDNGGSFTDTTWTCKIDHSGYICANKKVESMEDVKHDVQCLIACGKP